MFVKVCENKVLGRYFGCYFVEITVFSRFFWSVLLCYLALLSNLIPKYLFLDLIVFGGYTDIDLLILNTDKNSDTKVFFVHILWNAQSLKVA